MSEGYLEFMSIPKTSALICWPVEWSDQRRPVPKVPNLHVTCIYIPDALEIPKQKIIDVVGVIDFNRQYAIGKVSGVDNFGPEKDVPVMRVDTGWDYSYCLRLTYDRIKRELDQHNVKYDNRYYGYNPHCTVDLQTVLNPPKRVVLRPLELWYMDDEPVAL